MIPRTAASGACGGGSVPDARKLAREKREHLRQVLESDESADLTQEEIAEQVGCSTASVQRYIRRWDLDGDDGDRIRSRGADSPFRQEPVDRLRQALEAWQVHDYAPERFERCLKIANANPGILASPDQLHQFLTGEVKLKKFTAEQVVRAVFKMNPHAPGTAAGSVPPSGAGGGFYFPPRRQPATADDVASAVKEAVAEVVEQLDGTEYEEVARPVLDDDGNILRDESGAPVREVVRRPIDANGRGGGADPQLLKELLDSKVAAARAEERAEREQALAEVRASQDLDGEAQVIRDGIQAVEKQASRFTEKTDSRLDRLERAAMVLLSEGGAENLSPGDVTMADVEDLRDRQRKIDARETGANPHIDADHRVDQRVDEPVDDRVDRDADADADDAIEETVASSRWPGAEAEAADDGPSGSVPRPAEPVEEGEE